MAHFFNPENGVPITEIEVPSDGSSAVALYGGGPGPDYEYLTAQLSPGGAVGLLGAPFGDDLGNHNRQFSLKGSQIANGAVLHAYVTLPGGKLGAEYARSLTVHVFPKVMLSRPLVSKQDTTKSECWAAAFASWCKIAKGSRAHPSKDELTKKYGNSTDNGITETQLANILSVDLDYKFDRKASLGSNNLLLTKLSAKLKGNGHVVMVYKSGYQSSHALVVYGVGAQNGRRGVLFCMDPWYGTYNEYPASDFYDKPVFILYP